MTPVRPLTRGYAIGRLCTFAVGVHVAFVGLFGQRYLPGCDCDVDHLADILMLVRLIERQSATVARIHNDGVVEFWAGTTLRWAVGFASARGKWEWTALEPRIERARGRWHERPSAVRKVIVAGAGGASLAAVSAPPSTIAGNPGDDIISGGAQVSLIDAFALRGASQAEIEGLLSA